MDEAGVDYGYESRSFSLLLPKPGMKCESCGSKHVVATTRYTPDWFLPTGVIVESKGRFTPRDRKIALAMQEQHPEVEVRLLFKTDNKLSPASTTRYSEWCDKHNIPFAVADLIPEEWYDNKPKRRANRRAAGASGGGARNNRGGNQGGKG